MGLSPMMQHYLQMKEKYKDCILMYRLGDFYEMFFDDAKLVSRELELTLTGRDCGLEERAPMCGVPYHAVDSYVARLIDKGHKVAICEQLTEPENKGLVERDVVRVITPGTVMDAVMLKEDKNNFIASVCMERDVVGIAWADLSTGEFLFTEVPNDPAQKAVQDNLTRISPAEILANQEMFARSNKLPCVQYNYIPKFTCYYDWAYQYETANKRLCNQLGVASLDVFGCAGKRAAIGAAGALVEYLNETQKRSLSHINKLNYVADSKFMVLDVNTRRNLELTETLRDRKKYGSLLWLLDNTKTSMGARTLYNWIEQPLQDKAEIDARLNAVEEIKNNLIVQESLSLSLGNVRDIERLSAKIAYNSVTPKDVEILGASLKVLPEVERVLGVCKTGLLKEQRVKLNGLEAVADLIERAIVQGAPTTLKDGHFIKRGYNQELDAYMEAKEQGQNWIANLEGLEREKTGIKNLKIGYNRVFGYFIEVTKSYQDQVPYRYTRKQTLSNCERYVTEELKAMEDRILSAEDNSVRLELRLFDEIRGILLKNLMRLQEVAKAIAVTDVVLSLAVVANKHNYVKPVLLADSSEIRIQAGRHPVVEALLKSEQFIDNDTYINKTDARAMIITGPNMAGKSTYMRQVALITLMAHIGSFVPAQKAEIAITDKIFTRVGASDNLAFAQSTFMVEMTEVAHILHNATNNSLIILDEVGRGTSTYDGLSIAWSVMEYIAKHSTAKTLFATHYHELTELESKLEGVKNYQVLIKELSDGVIFLRKIVRGGADKSFGIEVAKLAGLPKPVISRAKEILHELEQSDINNPKSVGGVVPQLPAKYTEVIHILQELDVNACSPLVAFNTLVDLANKVKGE